MHPRTLLILSLAFFANLAPGAAGAQTIHIVPGMAHLSLGGPVVVYNNKLYLKEDVHGGRAQLAAFDGTSETLVPNPPNPFNPNAVCGYTGDPFVFNDKLYIACFSPLIDQSHQLAVYDGNGVTLIYNLLSGVNDFSGPVRKPFVTFQNKLYIIYRYQTQAIEGNILARVDDMTLKTIPNPYDAFPQFPLLEYQGKLYFSFNTGNATGKIGWFDGAGYGVLPNPDGGRGGWGNAIAYSNLMYLTYSNKANISQLARYDGATMTLLPNPDGGPGCAGKPVHYGNALYLPYINDKGIRQLAKYDGAAITLIPNPPGGVFLAEHNDLLVCGGKLCMKYSRKVNNAGALGGTHLVDQWAQYDGGTLTLIPNPAGVTTAEMDEPVQYNNKLYILFKKPIPGSSATSENLGQLDGGKINLVPHLQNMNGISLTPYDNKLYISYLDTDQESHVAYIDSYQGTGAKK